MLTKHFQDQISCIPIEFNIPFYFSASAGLIPSIIFPCKPHPHLSCLPAPFFTDIKRVTNAAWQCHISRRKLSESQSVSINTSNLFHPLRLRLWSPCRYHDLTDNQETKYDLYYLSRTLPSQCQFSLARMFHLISDKDVTIALGPILFSDGLPVSKVTR